MNRKNIFTVLILSLLSISMFAQQRGGRYENLENQLKLILTSVDGVNVVQKTALTVLFDEMQPRFKAIKVDTSMDQESKRMGMKNLKSEMDVTIKNILDEKQYAQYLVKQKEMQQSSGRPGGKRGHR